MAYKYRGKYPHRVNFITYVYASGWHVRLNNGEIYHPDNSAVVLAFPVRGIECGMDWNAVEAALERVGYPLDSLEPAAHERAHSDYLSDGDSYHWQSESWDSAQAFSRIAPIDIREADYSRGHVTVEWTGPDYASRYDHSDAIAELSGLRAWKWLQNNGWFEWAAKNARGDCTMTGYCMDCPFGDAIAAYAAKPLSVPDLRQVFYESAQAWLFAVMAEIEYSESFEAFKDMADGNDWRFNSEGVMV